MGARTTAGREQTVARRIGTVTLVAVVALGAEGCGDAVAPDPIGTWGGPHVRLEITRSAVGVSPSAGGTIEFDCAHGGLGETVLTDKSGRFDVAGYYVQEHGGPVRADQPPDAKPARYSGEINGSRMTLIVVRTDSAWSAGPFTLQRGSAGMVFKCL